MKYSISNKISDIKIISERLDYIRREQGLNQEQLAAHLGISQPAVSKYLKERMPPADILLKVAELGGTTVEWILTGQKKHFYSAESLQVKEKDASYLLDADIQLARKIARLKPRARQSISSLIDLLCKETQ